MTGTVHLCVWTGPGTWLTLRTPWWFQLHDNKQGLNPHSLAFSTMEVFSWAWKSFQQWWSKGRRGVHCASAGQFSWNFGFWNFKAGNWNADSVEYIFSRNVMVVFAIDWEKCILYPHEPSPINILPDSRRRLRGRRSMFVRTGAHPHMCHGWHAAKPSSCLGIWEIMPKATQTNWSQESQMSKTLCIVVLGVFWKQASLWSMLNMIRRSPRTTQGTGFYLGFVDIRQYLQGPFHCVIFSWNNWKGTSSEISSSFPDHPN